MPHARCACLVLDFSEPNCDWSKKNDVMEIVCGFVFADVFFGDVTQKPEYVCVRRLTVLLSRFKLFQQIAAKHIPFDHSGTVDLSANDDLEIKTEPPN